uniref:Enhancer of polycomb-like protein 1 n=1 Tax=Lygus hesperus TaxID=30085 RepID=A0A0A9ZAK3_LYGHE
MNLHPVTGTSGVSNSNNSSGSHNSSIINSLPLQALMHNIPFVGLLTASVQQSVSELPGLSSLSSTMLSPTPLHNFNNNNNVTASSSGTNHFILIGCRERNHADRVHLMQSSQRA